MSQICIPVLDQANVFKEVTMNTRNSSLELSNKLTSHIEELAQATDTARVREAMLAYSD